MTVTKLYKITYPISFAEFELANRYTLAESSKYETGGGEGVTILGRGIKLSFLRFRGA